MNPRTPVLVGVGQVLDRTSDLVQAQEPLKMMLQASRLAEQDTGTGNFLAQMQSVRVIRGMWRYDNPAKLIAEEIGAIGAETVGTLIGGNQNQAVINQTASEILNNGLDIALITGAENGNSAAKARKAGIELEITNAPGKYDKVIGATQQPEHHDYEVAKGIRTAIQIYPMYDNAIRHHRGESLEEHIVRVSSLWERFNEIGCKNPNAWVQTPMSAEQIRTPSKNNRRISFPYTKFMNANMSVNMGAALIMCSVQKAQTLGIDPAKWIYPWAGVSGYDHFSASVRDNFYTSPAIRLVAKKLLELSETQVNELSTIDLYSCFPSAVQIAAQEYGLEEDRPLTVTGGLTFGGGPLNNYVMHSIARTVELLRETTSGKGLVTANGGNLYKHVHGIYAKEPPQKDFRVANVQDQIDALPSRVCLATYQGEAMIESYTVMYDSDEQPTTGHISCLTPDGQRTWVNTADTELAHAMTESEFCGKSIFISDEGRRLKINN